MIDVYVVMETIEKCVEGDFPKVQIVDQKRMNGGAGMVYDVVRELQGYVIKAGEDAKNQCQKNRAILDGNIIYRLDLDFTDAIHKVEEEKILRSLPEDLVYVLLADYGKGVVTYDLFQRLIAKYQVIVDPANGQDLTWYEGAYGIIPNRVEAQVKCIQEAKSRCRELLKYFPFVCIKLDVDGMVFNTEENEVYHLPSSIRPIETVDTCGAGDVVLASIGFALQRDKTWEDACYFANQMAGKKCRYKRWE